MAKKVLSLIVDNTSGVLSRISGLFSRRGYNIDSISAGVTADPRFTRITIVTSGDDHILDQIEKQIHTRALPFSHISEEILKYPDEGCRDWQPSSVKRTCESGFITCPHRRRL